jgi:Family of unknown function (DUF6318)
MTGGSWASRGGRFGSFGWTARSRLLALVAVGCLLACAGCTGSGDDPPASVTTTASPPVTTTATTPTVEEPAKPVARRTPESAVAFVRYFWALYNYAYATYDVAALQTISESSCRYCASTISDIQKIHAAKTRVEGYGIKVVETASPPVKITTGTLVIAVATQDPGRAVYADGKSSPLKGIPRTKFNFSVGWSQEGWSVEGVDYEAVGSK